MTQGPAPLYVIETHGHLWWKTHKIKPLVALIVTQLQNLSDSELPAAAKAAGHEAGLAALRLNRTYEQRMAAAELALHGGFALGNKMGAQVEAAYCAGVVGGVWNQDQPE